MIKVGDTFYYEKGNSVYEVVEHSYPKTRYSLVDIDTNIVFTSDKDTLEELNNYIKGLVKDKIMRPITKEDTELKIVGAKITTNVLIEETDADTMIKVLKDLETAFLNVIENYEGVTFESGTGEAIKKRFINEVLPSEAVVPNGFNQWLDSMRPATEEELSAMNKWLENNSEDTGIDLFQD